MLSSKMINLQHCEGPVSVRSKLDKLLTLNLQTKWEINKINFGEMIKSDIKSPLDLNNTIHCYTTKIWSYQNKIEKFYLKKQKNDNFITTQSSNFVNFNQKITGEQII